MRNERLYPIIVVGLISIMLLSTTIVTVLPSATLSSSSHLSIREAFAQDTDEEEPEPESSEEPTDGSTDISCEDGQVLEDGECVEPPEVEPPDPECPEGQVLEDGECVDPTVIDCEDGQVLEDGECVEPPEVEPPDPECPEGQVLEDGECVVLPQEPVPIPTPAPEPTPGPTNPDGLVQEQPVEATAEACGEIWNLVIGEATAPNSNYYTICGSVNVNTKDRGIIPISNLHVEVCTDGPSAANLMCGSSQKKTYTKYDGSFTITLTKDERKQITHVMLRSINEDKTLLVTHPAISAMDKPAEIKAKIPTNPASSSPDAESESIRLLFYSPLSKGSTNSKSFLQINFKDIVFPDWSTNNVPADQVADLLLVHHYTSQSMIYAKTTLRVPLGTSAVTKSLVVQVFSAVGSRTAYPTPSVPIIYLEVADSTFDSPDKKPRLGRDLNEYHFFVLFHELGHFIDFAAVSGQTTVTSRELHHVLKGQPTDCHWGYGQRDSSCAFEEARATYVGFLLKDNVLNDGQHAYYQKLLKYYVTEKRTADLKAFIHIVGPRMNSPGVVFTLDNLAEEIAYSSLLWSLYDNAPSGGENISIHPKTIMDQAFLSKTVKDFYQKIVGSGVQLASLQSLFAKYGICIDINNDGRCTVGSNGDTIDGRSAWKNVRFGLKVFGYPQGRP